MKSVCVFLGSQAGLRPAYAQAVDALTDALAERQLSLVYGGASVGLMGTLASAALQRGVPVTGVIPRTLVEREVAHEGLDRLEVVDSMLERKQRMLELSDAFVALPGGIGTLDELFEVLTWSHLGLHRKPCGLLDVAGYWSGLEDFLDHAVREGFLHAPTRDGLLRSSEPGALLDQLSRARARP